MIPPTSTINQHKSSRPRSSPSHQLSSPITSKSTYYSHSARPSKGENNRPLSSASLSSPFHIHQMDPSPSSPTPRKARRPRPKKDAVPRETAISAGPSRPPVEEGQETSSEDDQALFELLGVTSPPVPEEAQSRRGLLSLTKDVVGGADQRSIGCSGKTVKAEETAQLGSPKPKTRGGRPPKQKIGEGQALSDGDQLKGGRITRSHARSITGEPSNTQTSKKGTNRNIIQPKPILPDDDNAFDVTALSQSLPSTSLLSRAAPGRKKGRGKESEDESAVWDMPSEAGRSSSHEMTWQQKLHNSAQTESPKKPTKSDRKTKTRSTHLTAAPPIPSPLTHTSSSPYPTRTRRLSLDQPKLPYSTFDETPYHVGLNVNRPPQTPSKLGKSKSSTGTGTGTGMGTPHSDPLPVIQGEFPRLGKGMAMVSGNNGFTGIKYAGPTFHNSPHAGSLPKPDLDDF